jgi:hypothetical protein
MKKGKRRVDYIFIAAAVVLVAVAWAFNGITFETGMKDWRDGDLIVQQATDVPVLPVFGDVENPPVHIGIVTLTPDGPMVIEARDTVVETPLKAFIAAGYTNDYVVYRITGLDRARATTVVASARGMLGRPGDFFLDETPERLYSSELVRISFLKAGVSLGRTDRMRTLARGNRTSRSRLVQSGRTACRAGSAISIPLSAGPRSAAMKWLPRNGLWQTRRWPRSLQPPQHHLHCASPSQPVWPAPVNSRRQRMPRRP